MAGCDVRALSPLARKQGRAHLLRASEPMESSPRPITDAVVTFFFAQIVESLSRARVCPHRVGIVPQSMTIRGSTPIPTRQCR